MSLLIGFLTFILVLNCLLLMLLVLIQLPKKEAGAGVAFGGGAADALFGAGSGNALTQMTKYTATFFVGLAILLTILNSHRVKDSRIERLLDQAGSSVPAAPLTIPNQPQAGTPAPVTTSPLQIPPAPTERAP
jgi:protein translocase SecG subunit